MFIYSLVYVRLGNSQNVLCTVRDGIKKILGQSLNYLENVRAAVEAV